MKIELKCSLCGNKFSKENSEYNRRKKQGQTNFYCSRKCGGSNVNTINNISKNWGKNNHFLKRGSSSDEFSVFREHLRRIRRRNHKYDVSLDDLKTQWDMQNGKCVYTGVSLHFKKCDSPIYMASLDRINSNEGYVKGNIQWVSAVVNYAKSNMTHEQMLTFIDIVKQS